MAKFTYHIYNKKIVKPGKRFFYGDRVKKFFPGANSFGIYGAGRIGKTTWFRTMLEHYYKPIIKEFFKKNPDAKGEDLVIKDKFALLTRKATEIDQKRKEIFGDFDNWSSIGVNFYIRHIYTKLGKDDKEEEITVWVNVGAFLDINTADTKRGGKSFNDYKFIFWDEFMAEHGSIAQESTKLKSLITTIMSDKNMECWFFSNYVGKDGTLFKIYGFNPDWISKGQQCYIPSKGVVFIHMGQAAQNFESYKNSALFKMLGEDDDYLRGRFFGEVYHDQDLFVERDDKEVLKPKFNCQFLGNKFGVYSGAGGKSLKLKNKLIKDANMIPLSEFDARKLAQPWVGIDKLYPWWNSFYNTGRFKFEDTDLLEIFQNFLLKYK